MIKNFTGNKHHPRYLSRVLPSSKINFQNIFGRVFLGLTKLKLLRRNHNHSSREICWPCNIYIWISKLGMLQCHLHCSIRFFLCSFIFCVLSKWSNMKINTSNNALRGFSAISFKYSMPLICRNSHEYFE